MGKRIASALFWTFLASGLAIASVGMGAFLVWTWRGMS